MSSQYVLLTGLDSTRGARGSMLWHEVVIDCTFMLRYEGGIDCTFPRIVEATTAQYPTPFLCATSGTAWNTSRTKAGRDQSPTSHHSSQLCSLMPYRQLAYPPRQAPNTALACLPAQVPRALFTCASPNLKASKPMWCWPWQGACCTQATQAASRLTGMAMKWPDKFVHPICREWCRHCLPHHGQCLPHHGQCLPHHGHCMPHHGHCLPHHGHCLHGHCLPHSDATLMIESCQGGSREQ